jgi:formyl-CoA transferase
MFRTRTETDLGADLPLADLRVIDLTVARAGPNCVRQLADWGADVIRIDAPPTRTAGEGRHSSDFQNLHRNKRSILLDLTTADDKATLMRLVEGADVLVENMRPSVKSRLGFGYEEVHERNPRLVYGSISGFGQDGPYADRGAYDQIIQGMGGLMSVTGTDSVPARAGIAVSDLAAGHQALGHLTLIRNPVRMTGVGPTVRQPSPELGEHTAEVLAELGG